MSGKSTAKEKIDHDHDHEAKVPVAPVVADNDYERKSEWRELHFF